MKILFLLLLSSSSVFACQARPDQYSFDKSYEASASVVAASVLKQVSLGGRKYRITFEVIKTWKGKAPSTFTTEYTDSMCAPFGEWAKPGLKCLLFLTADNGVIATPAASFCDQKGAGSLKEFEKIIERRK